MLTLHRGPARVRTRAKTITTHRTDRNALFAHSERGGTDRCLDGAPTWRRGPTTGPHGRSSPSPPKEACTPQPSASPGGSGRGSDQERGYIGNDPISK